MRKLPRNEINKRYAEVMAQGAEQQENLTDGRIQKFVNDFNPFKFAFDLSLKPVQITGHKGDKGEKDHQLEHFIQKLYEDAQGIYEVTFQWGYCRTCKVTRYQTVMGIDNNFNTVYIREIIKEGRAV